MKNIVQRTTNSTVCNSYSSVAEFCGDFLALKENQTAKAVRVLSMPTISRGARDEVVLASARLHFNTVSVPSPLTTRGYFLSPLDTGASFRSNKIRILFAV